MHSTSDKAVRQYKQRFREDVYLGMELSGSSYIDILEMPVLDFREYVEWKIKFDNEKEKQRSEALNKIR